MTVPRPASPSRGQATFLLADISGYTSFLHGVADAHRDIIVEADEPPVAYALLSSLIDTMVESLAPAFRLAKLEGDALFVLADDPATIHGHELVHRIRSCHAAFERVLAGANEQWVCTCNACSRIHDLGIKFVVHHGGYVVQRIVGNEELAGPDVIVVHRLLKNHARDLVGTAPYALLSDATLEALEVPPDGMLAATETYDDLPPVPVHVLPLA
jgi:hypothetical protein